MIMTLPWIRPWVDLAKNVNTNMRGNEYFIPTKFGNIHQAILKLMLTSTAPPLNLNE